MSKDETMGLVRINMQPGVAMNHLRKCRASNNFRYFCEVYFSECFTTPWSEVHIKVMEQIEKVFLHGGHVTTAMPRGSGKTTFSMVAAIWSLCYGHCKSTVINSKTMLDAIKTELAHNETIKGDFPEVCPSISNQIIANEDGVYDDVVVGKTEGLVGVCVKSITLKGRE